MLGVVTMGLEMKFTGNSQRKHALSSSSLGCPYFEDCRSRSPTDEVLAVEFSSLLGINAGEVDDFHLNGVECADLMQPEDQRQVGTSRLLYADAISSTSGHNPWATVQHSSTPWPIRPHPDNLQMSLPCSGNPWTAKPHASCSWDSRPCSVSPSFSNSSTSPPASSKYMLYGDSTSSISGQNPWATVQHASTPWAFRSNSDNPCTAKPNAGNSWESLPCSSSPSFSNFSTSPPSSLQESSKRVVIETKRGPFVMVLDGKPPFSRKSKNKGEQCNFCMNNGERPCWYRSHVLHDPNGVVSCPVLRAYNCPLCNSGGGDYAHTVKYCPLNKGKFISAIQALRTPRIANGKLRNNCADKY